MCMPDKCSGKLEVRGRESIVGLMCKGLSIVVVSS